MTPRFVRLSFALWVLAASTRLPAQTPPTTPVPGSAGSAPAVTAASPLVKPADDDMVPNFKLSAAPIDAVLGALELYTGRTILRPAALQTAEYSIKIDRPIPKSELILALLTLLKHNQIGVSPQGERFLNVVPLATVKTEAPETIEGSTFSQPASGKIATKIFQLDFLRVSEFMPQIQGLLTLGIGGGVVILEKTNAALVTDTVSNLQRIETLLKALDHPATAGLTPKFYTLRNGAKASDLVNKMRTILGTLQNQIGSATSYNADDRTNQIILIADSRQYPFFDDLIAKLDIKADPNTRNEVIYLKHAAAKDVSTLLGQIVTGQANATQKNNAQSVRPGQVAIPGQPVTVPPPGVAPQPAAPVAAAMGAGGDPSASTNEFSSLLTVTYDDRSNAVVVSGTGDDIRLIKDLVDKIDIVLAQVRIEVIIAEVTLTDSDQSGISALGLTVNTDTPNGTATNGDNGRGTHITGVSSLALAGWNVTSGVVNPLSFTAALANTGSRSNVKILQAPTIVTTHAKEAEVIVGEQFPVVTGTTTTAATAGGTTSTYNYKNIAVDLKVTPLIGDDGSIQLKIDQKVDDILDTTTIDTNQVPIIGTREATSFINVYDGQMVVLGGLQRTKKTTSRGKLGFFAEIPILSQILGARSNTLERTELLLFVRPHVIKPGEGSSDTSKTINGLSNKDQINQFLIDPSKPAKEPLLEKLK
jgi:general secretion pathway protein D